MSKNRIYWNLNEMAWKAWNRYKQADTDESRLYWICLYSFLSTERFMYALDTD